MTGATTEIVGSVTDFQASYAAADPNNEKFFSPTASAIRSGAIHFAFLIQHNKKNPTHELWFCSIFNRPVLYPLRVTDVGEEFTYDYGYDRLGDVKTT